MALVRGRVDRQPQLRLARRHGLRVMQAQRAELWVLHHLGAALSLDHLVLVPPLAKPRAVLAELRQELLVLRLARMARVLGAKPRQRVASGSLALRRHAALARIDHQPPQADTACPERRWSGEPSTTDAARFQARILVIGPSR